MILSLALGARVELRKRRSKQEGEKGYKECEVEGVWDETQAGYGYYMRFRWECEE
jgi:hypothetical protein